MKNDISGKKKAREYGCFFSCMTRDICFFCKYRDKNLRPGSHQALPGRWRKDMSE